MTDAAPGFSVCVYCASSDGVAEHYLDLAGAVGRGVADRGWTLVSGGGRRSMMGAVAAGARSAGGRTVGIIPKSMVDWEWADHESDELVITDSMRDRKRQMEERSDAFLALPGGIGTCEELFEVWTSGVLGLHDKPVVVLDPDGHWDGLLDWVAGLQDRGFAARPPMGRLQVVRSDGAGPDGAALVGAALDACARPVA
ncbi:Lysine decarboxylase family [Pseudonocardia sp. Ae168_Ps1]|uniref:LOG family protein n=1 Tax=unclassified Pseudonocardia TaxID=2619320 RepID=UPI0001FFF409|nr:MULTISPECIES: TIGR00730 family Rossman fold protein [unclassified Pseudonocardia]ALE74948.1 decarboxylase [Pseudonocardia sp. EC080625-04]ALL74291.1 decarboxylase [Pseudonocardia sp. EC080610-09]ALL81314.1 decarboxylase [Pseudonocardia sp. EC080619-01]OLL75770.1 Lysine decarboxylase family [Pseudonocardia sp. Ae150A_Ps1]OLL81770.1 Lysine decarboxylase family [Pseudonocardia sp. Ae168_Ps1]